MPRQYHDYQFSAFRAQDLFGWGSGDAGSQFTVPTSGAVTISVRDDEANLGGDLRWNEHADDLYVSGASIRSDNGHSLGNGGKIYGENYTVVQDTHGNEYRMVRVEQEGTDQSYYAFDRSFGLPSEGTNLSVVRTYNVNKWFGDMSSYHNLTVPDTPDPVTHPDPDPDLGSISGRLFFDEDCDTTQLNEHTGQLEQGVAGNVVELRHAYTKQVIARTTTDANGEYSFEGVEAGAYNVTFEGEDGYVFVGRSPEGTPDSISADVRGDGSGSRVFVGEGEHVRDYDAGLKIESGSIEGTVFIDDECDGLQISDTYETLGENLIQNGDFEDNSLRGGYSFSRINDWDRSGKVRLDDRDYGHGNERGDAIVRLTHNTEVSQDVEIENEGTYRLTFDTLQFRNRNDEIEVRVDGRLVETIRVDEDKSITLDLELSSGRHEISFEGDTGGNRIYGAGLDNVELREVILTGDEDETKAGVTVALQNLDGTPVLDKNGDPLTTQTDEDGNYRFDNIPVGDYQIVGVAPDGTEFSLQDVGDNDDIDSDVDENGVSGTVEVRHGETEDVDIGICEKDDEPGSLSGKYFLDENRNFIDDDGDDNGIAGIEVTLLDADGNSLGRTTTTGEDGNYSFGDLEPGTYGVQFYDPNDANILVPADNGDDDSIDSDAVDLGDGFRQIDGISVTAGEDTPDNDAGVKRLYSDGDDDGQNTDDDCDICYFAEGPDQGYFDIDHETGALSNKFWFDPSFGQRWDADDDDIYQVSVVGRDADDNEISRVDKELVVRPGEAPFWRDVASDDEGADSSDLMSILFVPMENEHEPLEEEEEEQEFDLLM
ncbi:SdrD B-like domain-containing protein [Leisingera daeponensis]|uniref:SdrD B-like domain-containing protein n=1 Tax=Leisingera daeponensis TaxID=405746 RepID=UPI001378169C|nr:SdrD B-like domain-containing protein [Leisingera daeponensis]